MAALQDMLYGLICMSAPPGELWMKNQDADQKKRSSYVWLFQVGDLGAVFETCTAAAAYHFATLLSVHSCRGA
jgi:hypothetical protein